MLQDAAKVTAVGDLDRALTRRTVSAESLRGDREPPRLGGGEVELRHRRIVPGCAHGNEADG